MEILIFIHFLCREIPFTWPNQTVRQTTIRCTTALSPSVCALLCNAMPCWCCFTIGHIETVRRSNGALLYSSNWPSKFFMQIFNDSEKTPQRGAAERGVGCEATRREKKKWFLWKFRHKIPARIDRKIIVIYWLMVSSALVYSASQIWFICILLYGREYALRMLTASQANRQNGENKKKYQIIK